MSDRPGEIRLIAPRGEVPRTPENETRTRAILAASVAADAPPAPDIPTAPPVAAESAADIPAQAPAPATQEPPAPPS